MTACGVGWGDLRAARLDEVMQLADTFADYNKYMKKLAGQS